MISFAPFFELCKKRNKAVRSLVADGIIGAQTLNNMLHNRSITTNIIDRLCAALDCLPSDIFEYIPTPAPGEDTPPRLPARTATATDGTVQERDS